MSVAQESGRNRIMIYGPRNDGSTLVTGPIGLSFVGHRTDRVCGNLLVLGRGALVKGGGGAYPGLLKAESAVFGPGPS